MGQLVEGTWRADWYDTKSTGGRTAAKPDYSGRATVPVLWDTKTGTIVNNESAEILRIFNRAFDAVLKCRPSLAPSRSGLGCHVNAS